MAKQQFTAKQIANQQAAIESLHKAYNAYMTDVTKTDADRKKKNDEYRAGLNKLSAMLGTTTEEYKKQNVQINAGVQGLQQLARNAKLLAAEGKLHTGNLQQQMKMANALKSFAKDATKNDVIRNALGEKITAYAKKHVDANGEITILGNALVEQAQSALEVADKQSQVYSDIADLTEESLRNADMLGERELESLDTKRLEQTLMDAELAFHANKGKMTKKDRMNAEAQLNTQRARFNMLQAEAAMTDKMIQKSEAMTNVIMAPFEKAKGFIEALPGGKFLSQAFGLDAFGQTLGDITKKSMQVAFKKGPKAGIAHFKGLASQAKAFGAMLTGPQIAIIAIVALLAAAVMSFMKMAKQAKEFAKETGASYLQSKALVKESMKAQGSYKNQLSTFDNFWIWFKDIFFLNASAIKRILFGIFCFNFFLISDLLR